MPTHPRKHSDDVLIVADILKEAAEPRLAASVKKAFEKGILPLSPRNRVVGTRGGKTGAVKARVSR
jgi:hypothetical protein